MWTLFNTLRQPAKMGVTVAVWDLFLLIITLTSVTAYTQRVMHPAIIIVGVIWILATAGAIWHLGGVAVDSLFIARMMNTEVGREFTHALNLFFILGSTTVIFFALIPVYKYWPSAMILPVLLVGLFVSSNLAGRTTNWGYFYKGYLWLILLALISILVFGMTSITQDRIGDAIARPWDLSSFGSWIWRMVFFGGALLAVAIFIPKRINLPGRGLLGFMGLVLLLIGATLLSFPEVQAKLTDNDKPAATAPIVSPVAAPVTYSEPVAAAPQLPASAVFVKKLAPGERIYLTRTNMDAPAPERWAKFSDGTSAKFNAWPANEKVRYAENTIRESHDLYVVLPPGQNYVASATYP